MVFSLLWFVCVLRVVQFTVYMYTFRIHLHASFCMCVLQPSQFEQCLIQMLQSLKEPLEVKPGEINVRWSVTHNLHTLGKICEPTNICTIDALCTKLLLRLLKADDYFWFILTIIVIFLAPYRLLKFILDEHQFTSVPTRSWLQVVTPDSELESLFRWKMWKSVEQNKLLPLSWL